MKKRNDEKDKATVLAAVQRVEAALHGVELALQLTTLTSMVGQLICTSVKNREGRLEGALIFTKHVMTTIEDYKDNGYK